MQVTQYSMQLQPPLPQQVLFSPQVQPSGSFGPQASFPPMVVQQLPQQPIIPQVQYGQPPPPRTQFILQEGCAPMSATSYNFKSSSRPLSSTTTTATMPLPSGGSTSQVPPVNHALILSGGGSTGAYQVGALSALINAYPKYNPDMICGVSIGAMNTAFLAQYPLNSPDCLKTAVADLARFWQKIPEEVIQKWCCCGMLSGLCGKRAFFNTEGLVEFLQENISLTAIRNSGRRIQVGLVSLNTGEYHTFDPSHPQFLKCVGASMAVPGFVLPQEIDGQLWVDGGSRSVLPIMSAVDARRIDVIHCHAKGLHNIDPMKYNALDITLRSIDIMVSEIVANDLTEFYLHRDVDDDEDVSKNPAMMTIPFFMFRPPEMLIMKTEECMQFQKSILAKWMMMGYEDTVKKIEFYKKKLNLAQAKSN